MPSRITGNFFDPHEFKDSSKTKKPRKKISAMPTPVLPLRHSRRLKNGSASEDHVSKKCREGISIDYAVLTENAEVEMENVQVPSVNNLGQGSGSVTNRSGEEMPINVVPDALKHVSIDGKEDDLHPVTGLSNNGEPEEDTIKDYGEGIGILGKFHCIPCSRGFG